MSKDEIRVRRVVVSVSPKTLSVTHIFDGEEVVTGGDDGQVWVATFADAVTAQTYIKMAQRFREVYGERRIMYRNKVSRGI